jgi:MFS family permease
MAVLFLIVFVDLVGFGLLIPLLPFYVQRVGAGPELITNVLGLYSLAQFLAGPLWGRLSDRYGRKPILVITSVGLAVSYVMLAYADGLPLLILSRAFGGIMGANIGAAQAYISDITTPETRAKGMGMMGAAFGLGFIFGPAIGGVLGGSDVATANFFLPAMAAAAVTTVAAIGAVFFLKESLTPEMRAHAPRHAGAPLLARLKTTLGRTSLLLLTVAGFLSVTAWAQFETVFSLWANALFNYGPQQIGFILAFIGVVAVIVQGGAIGRLTRLFGERKLLIVSLVLLAIGYIVLSQANGLPQIIAACTILSVGSGLFNPSISSLVSKEAEPHERGAVLGTYQGATSLSRVVGPAFSGLVFAKLGTSAPFLVGVALVLPALAFMLALPRHHPKPA